MSYDAISIDLIFSSLNMWLAGHVSSKVLLHFLVFF